MVFLTIFPFIKTSYMWKVDLKHEVKRELKNPDRFATGMSNVYTGLIVAMCGVTFMFILLVRKPEDVLKPSWIILLGLGVVAWGEWQKFRSR
ncbi:MAG: hypothetical protein VYC17_05360 [Nitrospinota bacterium]|nr:hypothetical protein [Nitrospinota bacterium]